MHAKVFAIGSSVAILLIVIELIRRQKMTFKYSVVWLLTCILALYFSLSETPVQILSSFAGFRLPSNFIFFLLSCFVTLLSLLLTIYVNEQNSRSEVLAQSLAKLEYKIQKLEAKGRAI